MVDKESEEKILADYDANAHTYAILAPKLEQLLREILRERGIAVHSITSRPKSRKSLAGKIAKNDVQYKNLSDLTDLVGLRITTYFSEDVDRVAEAIATEFNIDTENSVDKRRSLAADRFGYLSLHHILSLKDSRCELTEYKAFKGIKVELQTRSILQHAWAEIEHDLGYKSEVEVPQHIRRRFALVAGLLELADKEFDGIKKELESYREEVLANIDTTPASFLIDADSVRAFIEGSPIVKWLDTEIIRIAGAQKISPMKEDSIPELINTMHRFKLRTIVDVGAALQSYENHILNFAQRLVGTNEIQHGNRRMTLSFSNVIFPAGVSVAYLSHLLFGTLSKDDEMLSDIDKEKADSYVGRIAREVLAELS
jgi:putative GTP pyrophosphokinase